MRQATKRSRTTLVGGRGTPFPPRQSLPWLWPRCACSARGIRLFTAIHSQYKVVPAKSNHPLKGVCTQRLSVRPLPGAEAALHASLHQRLIHANSHIRSNRSNGETPDWASTCARARRYRFRMYPRASCLWATSDCASCKAMCSMRRRSRRGSKELKWVAVRPVLLDEGPRRGHYRVVVKHSQGRLCRALHCAGVDASILYSTREQSAVLLTDRVLAVDPDRRPRGRGL